ncbi:hypothetical protein SERLA73DRAFT_152978 [Serpula lacrymans var. lacrymans S7.3]|uniref:Carboxylic ester hydrolase n=1 Tax=Serpula lacrymans var. lacrymans (strain S7.3) TaxID=936435 RepID=F8PX86_SERL3|nr:hypothetical protein SERLA73DRAFT_152978 [Serpula lacrymans var. lacrymans S7.3]
MVSSTKPIIPSVLSLLLLAIHGVASSVGALAGNASAPIVNLGYAQYQGALDYTTNITSFLALRYAAPPLGEFSLLDSVEGELRFQAPQPPLNETGVQQATTNPDMCYQTNYGNASMSPFSLYGYNKRDTTIPSASEDCLFLNVFVPGSLPAEPLASGGLPVVLWIHGGGYEAGYAAQYDGADLVMNSHNGVIAIVIQYRLGAFGFLSSDEVKAGGALNAGLLDQNYALQWVQKYIATFGGDPAQVTIWGESAGAGSVYQHIVANQGNTQPPLFRAAMTSSTFMPSQYYYNDRIPTMLYNEVVSYAGCSSSTDTLACLRTVNATTLETVNYNLAENAFYGTYIFVPVVDGTFIVERPSVTLAKGLTNGVGSFSPNSRGWNSFVNLNESLSVTEYVSNLFPDMTPLQVQEAAYMYNNTGTALEQAFGVYGDSIIVCPTYFLLQTFAGRSYKGLFAIPPGYHGNDIAYYFNNPAPPYNNTQFIGAFSESFMSFVMSLNVNAKFDPTNITPYWDEYYIGETEVLFNETEAGFGTALQK